MRWFVRPADLRANGEEEENGFEGLAKTNSMRIWIIISAETLTISSGLRNWTNDVLTVVTDYAMVLGSELCITLYFV
ncbi:hypothetical protein L1987_66561 [Smallanthus sonchifolius]|uniref:Uncharacterized protein n=1 Tax=Smallanthus sonchifolius TaxID=185202 RepID=A0ACB9BXN1_9ASTR|nr:hypothetical protein L1987_66561 [Smallanthus sonchifolius]